MQQQQQQQQRQHRRRSGTSDDFYTKLERIRLSAATKQHPPRTATELLNESKALFVKSEEVLHHRQTLVTSPRIVPSFRTIQPRRCPYQVYEHEFDQSQSDRSSPESIFESVSVLSFSDQTTLESTDSLSHRKATVVSSAMTIIERNARIIKWLFQLHKANELCS